MGLVRRLKCRHQSKNAKDKAPTSAVVVRNTSYKEQQSTNSQPIIRGTTLRVEILAEEAPPRPVFDEEEIGNAAPNDPSQLQRMHFDQLRHLVGRHAKESLQNNTREMVPHKKVSYRAKQLLPMTGRKASFLGGEEKDEFADSSDFIDPFFGLSLCGCDSLEQVNTFVLPPTTEKQKEEMEQPTAIHAPRFEEIPPTISFQQKTPSSSADDHVLLTAMDETASLDTSLITRIRGIYQTRKTMPPKIKRLYVQAPKRVGSDISGLTE